LAPFHYDLFGSVELAERPTHEGGLPTVGELYRMFDRVNLAWFGGKLPKPRIEYSNRMTAAGYYWPDERLIRIGRKYHQLFPDDIEDTLKHEMIHILHLKHNASFKSEARRIGASLKAKDHPQLQRQAKYVYVCENCRTKYPRRKRLRMASCGVCSPGQKYDSRYKLVLLRSAALKAKRASLV
jgi:SprT-like protein